MRERIERYTYMMNAGTRRYVYIGCNYEKHEEARKAGRSSPSLLPSEKEKLKKPGRQRQAHSSGKRPAGRLPGPGFKI